MSVTQLHWFIRPHWHPLITALSIACMVKLLMVFHSSSSPVKYYEIIYIHVHTCTLYMYVHALWCVCMQGLEDLNFYRMQIPCTGGPYCTSTYSLVLFVCSLQFLLCVFFLVFGACSYTYCNLGNVYARFPILVLSCLGIVIF